MKKFFLILLLINFIYFHSSASFDFNENCKNAYEKIISLRFTEGQALLETEKNKNPSNLIPCYLENYIDFLKLIISEEQSLFNTLKPNKDARISKIEASKEKDSPYYNYCIAEINLQWAFARIKFKEYFNAASEAGKAYKLLKENKEKFPQFIPNYKGLGVLHSLIGAIPDDYKWMPKIIGVTGTINQGFAELSAVLTTAFKNPEYKYLKTESLFFLAFIKLNLQSNKDEILKLSKYLENPNYEILVKTNPLLVYAAASIALRTGKNDKAIEILLSRPVTKEYYPFYYLDYLTGLAKLNRMDYDTYKYLYSYIINFKGQNYIKAAYQKLAWYYLINDNKSKYKETIGKILAAGNAFMDEDKQALAEAKSNIIPNIKLLKARLLCDGGYYQKALDMLLEDKPSNFCVTTRDYIEYAYRFGRIYDGLNLYSKAIPFYELTIKNGAAYTYYFAANAALHLGYIYENTGEKEKAVYYYELCKKMKNTEYKTSIEQKAKAGLNRLQSK